MSETPFDDAVRNVRFESADTGVTVVDEIERKREHIGTVPAVEPVPASTDRLLAPVDRAVELPVERAETVDLNLVTVRDDDFDVVDHLAEGESAQYPPGRYVVDIPGPVKRYLQVEGGLSIATADRTVVEVDDDATVLLGARSKHTRPTGEITVPPTPTGLARAITAFGSALKTTGPDRSWPNLRGHPPVVSVGETLDVPAGLEPPCPEVQVLVPPQERYLYAVAPLVYYLGAELVPHDGTPQLRTDRGFVHDLTADGTFETTVERTLKQVVFLECYLRSEGLLEYPLYELAAVDERLSLDPVAVCEQPPAARLPTCLDVDYETIADHVPDWEVSAHLAPRPDQVELLPYLVDDLAVVRVRPQDIDGALAGRPRRPSRPAGRPVADADGEELTAFFRSGVDDAVGDGWTVENSVDVRGGDTEALETVWTGDGVPVGASKVTRRAYENRFTRRPDPPPIDVGVVCNDDRMRDELDVTGLYDGEKLPMNVSTYRNLSRAALRTLIETGEVDFLHYIGHAEPGGLYCADGTLSLAEVDGTEIEAFLLNACESFDQGLALVDAGAIGGVVTLEPIPLESAVGVGKRTAKLLNAGYPLRSVVDIVGQTHSLGAKYKIVGDGGHSVAQRNSAAGFVHKLRPVDGNLSTATEYEVTVHAYPAENGLGGMYHPYHDSFGYYLIGNDTDPVRFRRQHLVDYMREMDDPVVVCSRRSNSQSLRWPNEIVESIQE